MEVLKLKLCLDDSCRFNSRPQNILKQENASTQTQSTKTQKQWSWPTGEKESSLVLLSNFLHFLVLWSEFSNPCQPHSQCVVLYNWRLISKRQILHIANFMKTWFSGLHLQTPSTAVACALEDWPALSCPQFSNLPNL